MNDMIIKPLEPDYLKKALKESWFIFKIQYIALILSALLFYGLISTMLNIIGYQILWVGIVGIFIAFYVAQMMVLLRVSSNRGLDLIVEVLTSIPKMIFLYIDTSKKNILLTTFLCVMFIVLSKLIFKGVDESIIVYSSLLLFFGIFIGMLENSFVLFIVAHQQAKEYESKEYVELLMEKIKLEGGWDLIKKIVFTTGLIIVLSIIFSIGLFSLVLVYLLGLFYSSLLYQMIEKPKKKELVTNIEKIVEFATVVNKAGLK